MPKQLLIDGHSLLFRAYHALPPLTTKNGTPTGALFGFATMLLKVLEDRKPDRVVVVFDHPQPTFRHEMYQDYKGTRPEAPDDFKQQVPLVMQFLELVGLVHVSRPGFEADDILGTLARMGGERGYTTEIITGDRDLLQVVGDDVTVYLTTRSGISALDAMDRQATLAKMGVLPEQIPDLKGLMGDSSDNIKGVAGIGEKSARQLIAQYGSIDSVYENLATLGNSRWIKALESQQREALTSRQLATIDVHTPIDWPEIAEPLVLSVSAECEQFLGEMELDSIRRRLDKHDATIGEAASSERIGEAVPPATVVPVEEFSVTKDTELVLLSAESPYWILSRDGRATQWSDRLPVARYIGWHTKSVIRALWERGVDLTFVDDGAIQAYLIDSEARAYDLAQVAERCGLYADERPESQLALIRALVDLQNRRLDEMGLSSLYGAVEMPLVPILARMEQHGIHLDVDQLSALGQDCERQVAALTIEIHEWAGMAFNISSTQQLAEVLFDRLNLPAGKKTKTGYSTDADTLEKIRLQHPIVDLVLRYRQLMKIKGTYVDGMVGLVGEDQKIHTTFHQTVAATGRLSSSDPNLQNIPVREPMGRQVRRVFIPSPGHLLSAADYSQIELRMLAHLSGDEHLIQAFVDGEDIHRRTAAEMFNIPWDEVDSTWRSRAKAINFGIIYGISGFGLARDTGVSQQEAADYIRRYFARYPSLKGYFDEILERARQDGAVSTILGRIRPLPDIKHPNRVRKQYAERMAINTVIQGSAADLIKAAMVAIAAESPAHPRTSVLTLQVHDELIWDMDPGEEPEVLAMAVHRMTTVMPLSVPLVVELKHGANWEQMTAFHLEAE